MCKHRARRVYMHVSNYQRCEGTIREVESLRRCLFDSFDKQRSKLKKNGSRKELEANVEGNFRSFVEAFPQILIESTIRRSLLRRTEKHAVISSRASCYFRFIISRKRESCTVIIIRINTANISGEHEIIMHVRNNET